MDSFLAFSNPAKTDGKYNCQGLQFRVLDAVDNVDMDFLPSASVDNGVEGSHEASTEDAANGRSRRESALSAADRPKRLQCPFAKGARELEELVSSIPLLLRTHAFGVSA